MRRKNNGIEIPKDLNKIKCKKSPTPEQRTNLRILRQNIVNLNNIGKLSNANRNAIITRINEAEDGHCCCINLDYEIEEINKLIIKTVGEQCIDNSIEVVII